MNYNTEKIERGSLLFLTALLVLVYGITSCQSKKQVEEAREISGVNTETSDIIISDSAAKQTQGVKLGHSWLVPDHVILENISEPTNIQSFYTLLRNSGFIEKLKSKGPFTLFIPTDSAFQKLNPRVKQQLFAGNNKQEQMQIVKHHLVSGKIVISDLGNQVVLKAADGSQLKVKNNGKAIQIDGATIKVKDGVSTNGVIHVIDRVLLPELEK
jgi:uncharacterized surface protein with fasciclin (FAS1) repeats